jgi:SpoVK/Ycf46/Vps4 family AAA+-type ATPase
MTTVTGTRDIVALLKSHIEGDEEQLFSVALQVAANEARRGHTDAAEELRRLVSSARKRATSGPGVTVPFAKARGELEGLLSVRQARLKLQDVVLSAPSYEQLARVVLEQRERTRLREHGKVPTQRLLLVGRPGTGKTISAEALAGELSLPFFVIRLEVLITRYLGETAAKLRVIFDEVARRRAVYLFDEFDAIGSRRSGGNDVAEMRRVLNSFLQFVEEYNATDSLIVAATNHPELLDQHCCDVSKR